MPTVRLEFTDTIKARIYERDRAVCCFCGTDLWRFRHGISPMVDDDWVDHILPASRKGDNSLENGIAACADCNSKKGDNTRDREYFYVEGRPTNAYFKRFNRVNPIVAETIAANAPLHWSDWYFNRAVGKLALAVNELWRLRCGAKPRKRPPAFWVKAALRFFHDWRRKRVDVSHPSERGLVPAQLEPDQELILRCLNAPDVASAVPIAEQLVPHLVGHMLYHDLKYHTSLDPELATAFVQIVGIQPESEKGIQLFLSHPLVIRHPLAEDLVFDDIAVIESGRLRPNALPAWPPLPLGKTRDLLDALSRERWSIPDHQTWP